MTVAYLVAAHDNPAHLQRLIGALSSPSSKCFVHIDRKSDIEKFHGLRAHDVHITADRRSVYWADFSPIEATLVLLRAAMADPRRFDRFVLLSGADYPLRSAAAIERFFARNPGKEFIDLVAMPADGAGKPLSRLTTYVPRPGLRRSSRKSARPRGPGTTRPISARSFRTPARRGGPCPGCPGRRATSSSPS